MNTIPSEILEKPFFSMTGSEILQLFGTIAESKTITQDFTDKKYVYGIRGLANLLGCGKTNAQKVKSSGIIDEAVYQIGQRIIIDSEKALELIKNKPQKSETPSL